MFDQDVRDRWTCVTNIQVIKHMRLKYKQVNAMYDLFVQPIKQVHE